MLPISAVPEIITTSSFLVLIIKLGANDAIDQLDEVFENKEQIAVSKFYEGLPKPWSIAMKELLNDELYLKQEESNDLDA